jgi:hypothetical protein
MYIIPHLHCCIYKQPPPTPKYHIHSLSYLFYRALCVISPPPHPLFFSINQVDADGQAAQSGVRVGWIISKVEGISVESEEEFKRAVTLARARGDDQLTITFSTVTYTFFFFFF